MYDLYDVVLLACKANGQTYFSANKVFSDKKSGTIHKIYPG